MRLGAGGVSSVTVLAGSGVPCGSCSCGWPSWSSHPESTPRAVAHEAGMSGVVIESLSAGTGLMFPIGAIGAVHQ